MATVTTTILIDGKIEIPESTRRSKHLDEGVRLQVIETADGILLRAEDLRDSAARDGAYSLEEILARNDRRLGVDSSANDWRSLEGILADDGVDTTEEKQRERDGEDARDRRKFGISRQK